MGFYGTALPAPQKGREVEASFARTGPNGLIGIPPFELASVLFVGLVKVHFTIIYIAVDIGKLVGDDVVVARIQACNDYINLRDLLFKQREPLYYLTSFMCC